MHGPYLNAEVRYHIVVIFIDNTDDLPDIAVEDLVILGGIIRQIVHGDIVCGNSLCQYFPVSVPDGTALCAHNDRPAYAVLELLLIAFSIDDLKCIKAEYEDSRKHNAECRKDIGSSPSGPSARIGYLPCSTGFFSLFGFPGM